LLARAKQKLSWPRRHVPPGLWSAILDLAALALLVSLGLIACGFLLRDDLFLYGDNPGQFVRLWYPVRVSHRLLDWNPLWYAGYPELQFYPPGFVVLGWGLDILTLSRLSPFALYQLLLFVAYILPGLTVYALVSRVSGYRWVGLVTGALALLFPELWGGAEAVFVGLVAERLAFGLVPLVLLAGWQALHARYATRWWLLTGLALAATVLMHPFHAVAPVLFLGLAALFHRSRWLHLRNLALAGVLALALVAFWLLPLWIRQDFAAPMLRSNLGQTLDWLFSRDTLRYLVFILLVPLALLVQRKRTLTVFVLSTLGMVAALVALILFDHLVLIDRLSFYLLDPIRFSAEVYLAIVLLAGLGLAHLPLWLSKRRRNPGWASGSFVRILSDLRLEAVLGGVLVILAIVWLGQPFWDMAQAQRDPSHFLSEARRTFPLDATWEALQGSEGRVLFTSAYLHLDDLPTALKAATPYFTGRTILGGTFSHWSPVARVLWIGTPVVQLLPGQVELNDDVALAGRSWDEWTDAGFHELCSRLNATTVATTWDDVNARTFLDAAPHFQSFYSDDLFVLYRVLNPAPTLVEAEGASVTLYRATPTELDLRVTDAIAGALLHVKITDYPLWRVQTAGQELVHDADALGLMRVLLPSGTYDVTLRYQPGAAERVGAWISLGAAVALLAILIFSFRNKGAQARE
jgi:hypothetical protein